MTSYIRSLVVTALGAGCLAILAPACAVSAEEEGVDELELAEEAPPLETESTPAKPNFGELQPIGGGGQMSFHCAMLNGAQIAVPIQGPNGGACTVTYKTTNCKSNGSGGCTCSYEVVGRSGDCG